MNNLMRRSGIIAVLCLVLCALLLVTACGDKGGDETTPSETTTGSDVTTKADEVTTKEEEVTTKEDEVTTTEPGEVTTEAPKTTYTVVVKDQNGNVVKGVSVQLCAGEVCLTPVTTGANGEAVFSADAATYQAAVLSVPTGYTADTTKKYDFAANATTVEITITKEAEKPSVDGAVTITDDVGSEATPETAELNNNKLTYVYEALTDGELSVKLLGGEKASISISNVTTGKGGVSVDGLGAVTVATKANNTYLITISATEAVEVKYVVDVADAGNGTKENPFVLELGMVERTFAIKAGETVYCIVNDPYFYIATPNVSVVLNGVTYAADNNGDIYGSAIGLEEGDLIGLTAAADVTVTVNLTGSDAEHPLNAFHLGYYELKLPASAVAYIQATGEALNAVVDDEVLGNITVALLNGTEAPFVVTAMNRANVFTVKNNSNSRLVTAGFQIVNAPAGLDPTTAIELTAEDTYVEVSLYDQKVAASLGMGAQLYYTYTAAEYGYFKVYNDAYALLADGTSVDLYNDGLLVEAGDVVTFVVILDATDDAFVSFGIEYVSFDLTGLSTTITVPAGASVYATPSARLLAGGVYLKGVTGDVTVTSWGSPVAAPVAFSMFGLQNVLLTNAAETDVEVVVEIDQLPAGGFNNPIVMEGNSCTIDALTQTLYEAWGGAQVMVVYNVTEAGTLKVNTESATVVSIGDAVDMELDYNEGVEVKKDDVVVFVVTTKTDATAGAYVDVTFTVEVTPAP